MAYEITDTPSALKIVNNGLTKLIQKVHIKELSIVGANNLQIVLGERQRIFIPIGGITIPTFQDNNALLEELNNYITSYVRYRFEHEIGLLEQINSNTTNSGNSSSDFTLRLIDDRNPMVVYKGYTTSQQTFINQSIWAIERITKQDGIEIHEWADGYSYHYVHNWEARETYQYL